MQLEDRVPFSFLIVKCGDYFSLPRVLGGTSPGPLHLQREQPKRCSLERKWRYPVDSLIWATFYLQDVARRGIFERSPGGLNKAFDSLSPGSNNSLMPESNQENNGSREQVDPPREDKQIPKQR